MSCGVGPVWPARPRYRRYVAMNAPKKRQSDERNSHIPSLALATPVWVAWASCAPSSSPPDGSFTRRPSESSVYLWCHQSSRASTTGISAKLYSGGGDEIDHSSERPSHGSSPAILPRLVL